jgi:hypothetical protein
MSVCDMPTSPAQCPPAPLVLLVRTSEPPTVPPLRVRYWRCGDFGLLSLSSLDRCNDTRAILPYYRQVSPPFSLSMAGCHRFSVAVCYQVSSICERLLRARLGLLAASRFCFLVCCVGTPITPVLYHLCLLPVVTSKKPFNIL